MPGDRPRIIAVANQKGGVGKTTIAMQVSAALSRRLQLLLVDVDPQQSAAWWADNAGSALPFDHAALPGLVDVSRLRQLGARYDLIVVDTPGSLEDTKTLEVVLELADFVLVPLPPEPLAVNPTMRTITRLIEPGGVPYAVLLNRIDARVPQQLSEWERLVDQTLILPRFTSYLRQYRVHANAPAAGEVITSISDTRRTAHAIWDATSVGFELLGRLASLRPGA